MSWAQRPRSNADAITTDQLRDYLTFVASDEMEGRSTPSHGLDTTALFIATMLKRWGAKPGGEDGSFFQQIPMRRDLPEPEKSVLRVGMQTFVIGEDLLPGNALGVPAAKDFALDASLVYVGDGWLIKSKGIDDYQGVDVKGKIVVVNYTNGYSLPRGLTYADIKGQPGR